MNMTKKIMGAGVIAIDKNTGEILMARRGMKGQSPNCWAPFGGTFDAVDIIPRTTAIREFREETGCKVEYQLSNKPFFINRDNHLTFYSYIGIFSEKFNVQINKENQDFDWFDIDHLPENLHPGVKEMLNEKFDDLKTFIQGIKFKGDH